MTDDIDARLAEIKARLNAPWWVHAMSGQSAQDTMWLVEQVEVERARARKLREALAALGSMPGGYCFCYGNDRDAEKQAHTGECLEARSALEEESDEHN